MRATRRDPEALRMLISEHYPRVFAFCARRVGQDAAPDVAQETFVTMTQKLGSYKEQSSFATWLFGIAQNHCRNHSRKANRLPFTVSDWTAVEPCGSPEDGLVDRHVLRDALERLSQEHREVVVMHEIEGLSYAEIALILVVPEGTVKSRLHHAFQHLRSHVGGAQ